MAIEEQEASYIIGGIDKNAQDALYLIGYAIGILARLAVKVYLAIKGLFY